jgi:hypothetical protein
MLRRRDQNADCGKESFPTKKTARISIHFAAANFGAADVAARRTHRQ